MILIVPLVLLFSILRVEAMGLDVNVFTQVGFIVLIGLACKNAILIVEFAKQRQENGESSASAVAAARNRLRPIMMTSFAFILGVTPLVYADGNADGTCPTRALPQFRRPKTRAHTEYLSRAKLSVALARTFFRLFKLRLVAVFEPFEFAAFNARADKRFDAL